MFLYLARKKWSTAEKAAIAEHLGKFFRTQTFPVKEECMNAIKDPRLKDRTWKNVKDFVSHRVRRLKQGHMTLDL